MSPKKNVAPRPYILTGVPGRRKREERRRMKLNSLEAMNMNPATVDARRMKAVVFSPNVIVVSMCECS